MVGLGESKEQIGIGQCTSDAVLGKLHTPMCLAPMPSPSSSGGMDASTPLLSHYTSRFSTTLTLTNILTISPSHLSDYSLFAMSILSLPLEHDSHSGCLAPHLHAAATSFCNPTWWVTSAQLMRWTVGSTAALSLSGSQ